jgi:hypothetical protein
MRRLSRWYRGGFLAPPVGDQQSGAASAHQPQNLTSRGSELPIEPGQTGEVIG